MPTRTADLFLLEDLDEAGRTSGRSGGDLDALHAVADRIRAFVVGPHDGPGRAGPVCLFVPGAVERRTLWLAPDGAQEARRLQRDVGSGCHHAAVPVTLRDLEAAIRGAWSHETTFASEEYLARSPGTASRGQCGPTALVVHDLLGGELLVSPVAVGGTVDGVHYWNRLGGGLEIDLTYDQFRADEVVLPPRVVPRPGLPGPERARAAYLLLRGRVLAALSIPCGTRDGAAQ